MMACYQSNDQKIVSEWQEQKGCVEDAQQKWPEIAQVDQKSKEMAEEAGQAEIVPTIRSGPALMRYLRAKNVAVITFVVAR
jgi:hypothetical protein